MWGVGVCVAVNLVDFVAGGFVNLLEGTPEVVVAELGVLGDERLERALEREGGVLCRCLRPRCSEGHQDGGKKEGDMLFHQC